VNYGVGGKADKADSAAACCALCAAIASCRCWDYATDQPTSTNCWYDKPDCTTKQTNATNRISGRMKPGPSPPPPHGPSTAKVSVELSKAIGKTAASHVGLVFDGYTTDQHDVYRTAAWHNSNWVNANFSDPRLRHWVGALAQPSGGDLVIRVGGGPQDAVVFSSGNYSWSQKYANKGGGCNASVFDYRIGDCVVLTPQHYDAMLDFCADPAVGCKLVFGLSAMYGTCCIRYDDSRTAYVTGFCGDANLETCAWDDRSCNAKGTKDCRPWDPSNAREILRHTHARPKSHWPFGFELGNELAAGGNTVSGDRTPEQMLGNFRTLSQMIDEIWADTPPAERPRIIGPDNDFRWAKSDQPNSSSILSALADLPLHAFTYHAYGGGGETDARSFAGYSSGELGGVTVSEVRRYAPKAEIWLGEGGGTGKETPVFTFLPEIVILLFSGGIGCSEGAITNQVKSNQAIDMYFYLDALAETAVAGHQRFLRETLAGGWCAHSTVARPYLLQLAGSRRYRGVILYISCSLLASPFA
jgi:hypothetical protein